MQGILKEEIEEGLVLHQSPHLRYTWISERRQESSGRGETVQVTLDYKSAKLLLKQESLFFDGGKQAHCSVSALTVH